MSKQQFDDLNDGAETAAKKKLSLDKFIQQFNSLDPSNYGGWPIAVKVTCWFFISLMVCFLGYFVLISSQLDAISTAQAQETNLLNDYRDKESKLRNLEQYKKQLVVMQQNFTQQLQQLPKESEIPGLVEDINITGVKSGLKFKNISLDREVRHDFFVEQPILIEASGDYHSFGQFTSGLAALPRIVTLHDFSITANQANDKKSDIPVITYTMKAKTYRYLGEGSAQENPQASDDGANNGAAATSEQKGA
ncbi:type 4a pilus biogenesis protein PilO [Acinetobacter sp. MD2(2019)]|uniref:type 4a pilus biogenesis protein PilO n=1 Tax=Acinetobacter sp. MD2(2019) TaxID=2605273 RepID=UPI002D1F4569|nr:type 4a pilus biogenesis protein PilO [Acinetobacter sp. MD2(2019)]MEB3753207.1 type 4a pilus biogenesis protein PilO [Acinetobacter sp. MD2(2019)]